MLADIALRRRDHAEAGLFDPAGRYGDVVIGFAVTVLFSRSRVRTREAAA